MITGRETTDTAARNLFRIAGWLTILLLAGIFLILAYNSTALFMKVKPVDFFTGSQWNPGKQPSGNYGILPQVVSTFFVTIGAMMIAVPLGIFTAAYLSEFAPGAYRYG